MKNLFLFLVLFMIVGQAQGQYKKGKKIPDTHEWIDYSLKYVKIKVYEDGICRLTRSQMVSAGLSGIVGSDIQLIRYGQEVPIFTSTNGTFSNSDYIEFVAEKHDGYLDKYLYMDSTSVPNPNHSLFSDTAVYYLAIDPGTTHMRCTVNTANQAVTAPTMDYAYFLEEVYTDENVTDFPKVTNPGLTDYTSSGNYYKPYCTNVFFFSNRSNQNPVKAKAFNTSDVRTGVPMYANFNYNPVFNNAYTTQHSVKFTLNNNTMLDTVFQIPYNSDYNPPQLIPLSTQKSSNFLSNGNNTIRFSMSVPNTFSASTYKIEFSIPFIDIYIPKQTNGFSSDVSTFYSAPNNVAETLRFDGLVANKSYVIYNTVTNTYTNVNSNSAGSLMYTVDASPTMDKYILYRKGNPNVSPVLLPGKKFKDITTNSDVNYAMITHHTYISDPTASGLLSDYKAYRESANGGSYVADIVDVDDIFENFGYGMNNHPYAIKAYLNYLHKNNNVGDSLHCFIICKGAPPRDLMNYDYTSMSPGYPALVCYADPGSDGLFGDFDFDALSDIAIGRIPIRSATELDIYFKKVKEYEAAINPGPNMTISNFIQSKNVMHLVGIGTGEQSLQNTVKSQLNSAAGKFRRPAMAGIVRTFVKQSSQTIEQLDQFLEDTLLNIEGQNIIGFYGHASTSNFDFNLSTPDNMRNKGKYFNMFAYGCTAGNQYILSNSRTISERYIFQPDAASITFSGTTSNGWTNVLGDLYITMAENIANTSYGQTIGTVTRNFLYDYVNPRISWIFSRVHAEQWTLNGDPAVRFANTKEPDLVVESKYITTTPSVIDGSQTHITGEVAIYNIGKGIADSVDVQIKKIMQDGTEDSVLSTTVYLREINVIVPFEFDIDPRSEVGVSKLSVTVDPGNKITEISEVNNEDFLTYKILSSDVIPAYPYDYSIVNYDSLALSAYTIDPLAPEIQYYLELDTTQLFNSPSIQKTKVKSSGGVITWKPGIGMVDSTVYYWRVRPDTAVANGEYRWKGASFVYLPQSSKGWNQSHYFQYLNNEYNNLRIDPDRHFKFNKEQEKITCNIANLFGPGTNYQWYDLFVNVGTDYDYKFGCRPFQNIVFVVIDSITGKPWLNYRESTNSLDGGSFNSLRPCNYSYQVAFEYLVSNPTERKQAMDFLDSIPEGHYVLAYNGMSLRTTNGYLKNTYFANDFRADTSIYGSNNSLYHKLKDLGFDEIDSFYKNRPFALFTQKGVTGFNTQQVFGVDSNEIINPEFEYDFTRKSGSMTSVPIGPSFDWKQEHWKGTDLEGATGVDTVNISLYGMDTTGVSSLFRDWMPNDASIAGLDHTVYPFARLKMDLLDAEHRTANQNDYWRINFEEAPDLAIAPNVTFEKADSLFQGQELVIKVAVQNISSSDTKDSFSVALTLRDKNNSTTVMTNTYPKLKANKTITAEFPINTTAISGLNSFNIIVNPDARVLESTYLNNSLFSSFYIGSDELNPLLDVTFDNVHIIDNDLVSSKPNILIEVSDDNEYLLLNDTSLFEMKLSSYNQGNKVDMGYNFSSSDVKFTPPTGTENKALVEVTPKLEDGTYILDFNAKDKTGNTSRVNYSIKFRVVNKSTITQILNYPNPFTTQTRFVFTLTGSEIPDDMLIQIFSASGKLVKEIRQSELGYIHVGTNITDYAWDGRDSHGDPVGNGVYFYRLKAKLAGNDIIHQETKVDEAFVHGIGKMYIIR